MRVSFQTAVCCVLKECFLVDSVIKAKLIDGEESLLREEAKRVYFPLL